jgi:hypothetical protein
LPGAQLQKQQLNAKPKMQQDRKMPAKPNRQKGAHLPLQ